MSKEVKISNSKDLNNTQKICCCNCCQSCNCCECCTSCQCCNCNNCCECECFWRAFALILITLILFYLDLFTLIIRLIAAVCFGCELFPFSRLFLNKCVGFQLPILGCYCCVLYSFCCDDSLKNGSSSGNSYSIGKPNRDGNNTQIGDGGADNKGGDSKGNEKKDWNYEPNYAYQMPGGRDGAGNPTYERYNQNYAYEMPKEHNAYGVPVYESPS